MLAVHIGTSRNNPQMTDIHPMNNDIQSAQPTSSDNERLAMRTRGFFYSRGMIAGLLKAEPEGMLQKWTSKRGRGSLNPYSKELSRLDVWSVPQPIVLWLNSLSKLRTNSGVVSSEMKNREEQRRKQEMRKGWANTEDQGVDPQWNTLIINTIPHSLFFSVISSRAGIGDSPYREHSLGDRSY